MELMRNLLGMLPCIIIVSYLPCIFVHAGFQLAGFRRRLHPHYPEYFGRVQRFYRAPLFLPPWLNMEATRSSCSISEHTRVMRALRSTIKYASRPLIYLAALTMIALAGSKLIGVPHQAHLPGCSRFSVRCEMPFLPIV